MVYRLLEYVEDSNSAVKVVHMQPIQLVFFVFTLINVSIDAFRILKCKGFHPLRGSKADEGSNSAIFTRPDISSPPSTIKGYNSFVRTNPRSDKISVQRFHHVEFYCGDATNTFRRFMLGLGMDLISKTDLSTGNSIHASYLLQSGDMRMLFTAPYYSKEEDISPSSHLPILPSFQSQRACNFTSEHGLGVCAIAVEVDDVFSSYAALLENQAKSVLSPTKVEDVTGKGFVIMAEVALYGDVVLRLIDSSAFTGTFLPNFEDTRSCGNSPAGRFGLHRFDHIVGNLWSLEPTMSQLKQMTVESILYIISLLFLYPLLISVGVSRVCRVRGRGRWYRRQRT